MNTPLASIKDQYSELCGLLEEIDIDTSRFQATEQATVKQLAALYVSLMTEVQSGALSSIELLRPQTDKDKTDQLHAALKLTFLRELFQSWVSSCQSAGLSIASAQLSKARDLQAFEDLRSVFESVRDHLNGLPQTAFKAMEPLVADQFEQDQLQIEGLMALRV